MTIPFDGLPLHEQRSWIEGAGRPRLHRTPWSSEAGGTDAFTPPRPWASGPGRRPPAVGNRHRARPSRGDRGSWPMSVATMAEAANLAVSPWAIGTSSDGDRGGPGNGQSPSRRPYKRTRDMVRFLRLGDDGGEKGEPRVRHLQGCEGSAWGGGSPRPRPILVAALRPGMPADWAGRGRRRRHHQLACRPTTSGPGSCPSGTGKRRSSLASSCVRRRDADTVRSMGRFALGRLSQTSEVYAAFQPVAGPRAAARAHVEGPWQGG